MFQNIFMYILLAIISFFPIVVWAYTFSYIDDNPLNKKRFLVWIIWWWLSVVPMLYMDKIINFLNFDKLNVFYFASKIKDLFSSLEFWLSLTLFLFVIVILSFLLGWWVWKKKELLKVYFKNILVFIVFILALSVWLFLLNYLMSFVDFEIENKVSFWNIISSLVICKQPIHHYLPKKWEVLIYIKVLKQ